MQTGKLKVKIDESQIMEGNGKTLKERVRHSTFVYLEIGRI